MWPRNLHCKEKVDIVRVGNKISIQLGKNTYDIEQVSIQTPDTVFCSKNGKIVLQNNR